MIVYSVRVKIDQDAVEDWLEWMCRKHIPDVMQTGFFVSSRLARVVTPTPTDRVEFRIDYDCQGADQLEQYQATAATELQREHTDRYHGKFEASREILEVVDA